MKAYASSGAVSAGSTPKTIKLLQVIIGNSGTPADAAAYFAIRKFTADGTGTAGTSMQADSADGAPSITTKNSYSAEPTYATGDQIEIALHQRNTVIWNPPTPDAAPANALGTANGLGIVLMAGPTGVAYNVTCVWDE
jgi:hypothetical protein